MKEVERQRKELRDFYEGSLFEFAKYVLPTHCFGLIHEKLFSWLSNPDANANQLALLPRGHLKSTCVAVWVAWEITRKPWLTFVYLSAGEDLASLQVSLIKSILTCDEYRALWPEMVNEKEGDRDKWSAWAFNVDHPLRKERGVRDYSVVVKTIKANSIGLHCDRLVLDDVVVDKNAYSAVGRREVQQSVAQFASIKNTGAITKAVGTVYHPKDLYANFKKAQLDNYNMETGEHTGTVPLWDVMEEVVEDRGDMLGNYLWPRMQSPITGEWYGFDIHELARKKAEYVSMGQTVQFYAQYYNNPNDPDSARLDYDHFRYIRKELLKKVDGVWTFNGKPLKTFCGVDVAYTDITESGGKAADYTAMAVIGIDSEGFIYVLDLRRFKTNKYDVYYKNLSELYTLWGFRKVQVESNAGGKLVAQEIKRKVREDGHSIEVIGKPASTKQGTKFERHAAVLEPRYRNGTIFHVEGGLTKQLEDEVVLERPPNDDLKDGVTIAIEISTPPAKSGVASFSRAVARNNQAPASRFGGRTRGRRGNLNGR